MCTKIGLLFWLLFFLVSPLQAADINLLKKLDEAQEHESNSKVRLASKYQIISMLIHCEFDEQCELTLIPQLENLLQKDRNPVYQGFLTNLKWQKSDLEFNIEHCQLPEKKIVRKEFAVCYQEWMNQEKSHPPRNRNEIDKLESQRQQCLKNKLEPLAQQGNLFAMAQMLNYSQYFKDEQGFNFWSAKMEALSESPKFKVFLRCAELP